MATSAQRRLAGRLGGLATSATHDPRQMTAPARAAFASKFEREVPVEVTDPAERARRADALRRAHFARLGLASAKARQRKTGGA